MSDYVKLMGERKAALFAGDEEKAAKLFEKIEKLMDSGEVTDDEFVAGAYL
mgnify:CR=1 FL=1